MNSNPYSLIFGQEPSQIIPRITDTTKVISAFSAEKPSQNIFMITGIRGSGKTVFMTEISNKLRNDPKWIIVELSSESDLLTELASELSGNERFAELFRNAKINLSFFGFGVEMKGVPPITSMKVAVTKMLESLSKKGMRVLVTVDEAVSNAQMKLFASTFQIFIRQKLPIFLLMTGLYENIRELQNEKTLTFLYRAPRIELGPLNRNRILQNYMSQFKLSSSDALEMTELTRGYSYAFQVLGYLTWEKKGDFRSVTADFRQFMEDYVYEKIWSELSPKDQLVMHGIAVCPSGKIMDIRTFLHMETNEFNPYRKRLIDKGLINGDERGYVKVLLPLFEEYVIDKFEE